MPLLCPSCPSASDDELKMQFENSGKIYLFANLHSTLHNEILHHIIYTTCACDDVERDKNNENMINLEYQMEILKCFDFVIRCIFTRAYLELRQPFIRQKKK